LEWVAASNPKLESCKNPLEKAFTKGFINKIADMGGLYSFCHSDVSDQLFY
jgi:hypothetical protein